MLISVNFIAPGCGGRRQNRYRTVPGSDGGNKNIKSTIILRYGTWVPYGTWVRWRYKNIKRVPVPYGTVHKSDRDKKKYPGTVRYLCFFIFLYLHLKMENSDYCTVHSWRIVHYRKKNITNKIRLLAVCHIKK